MRRCLSCGLLQLSMTAKRHPKVAGAFAWCCQKCGWQEWGMEAPPESHEPHETRVGQPNQFTKHATSDVEQGIAKVIVSAVCDAFKVTPGDMMGSGRLSGVVLARRIAYAQMRRRLSMSFPDIAVYFRKVAPSGLTCHGSIIDGIHKLEAGMSQTVGEHLKQCKGYCCIPKTAKVADVWLQIDADIECRLAAAKQHAADLKRIRETAAADVWADALRC